MWLKGLCLFLVLCGGLRASAPAMAVDDLLAQKFAQAEALKALDAEIEAEVSGEDGVTKTVKTRVAFDKAGGKGRMQRLDEKGQVMMEMKVEGTAVSFLSSSGQWKRVELDEQTKRTLEELGMEFGSGASKAGGLGGQGRQPKGEEAGIQKALAKERKLYQIERCEELDKEAPEGVRGVLGKACGRCCAVMKRCVKPLGQVLSHDAEVEWVEEGSGVVVERCRLMRAERVREMVDLDGEGGELDAVELGEKAGHGEYAGLKGARHPFHCKKAKLPSWARRMRDRDGGELVEVHRERVLKLKRVGGAWVPEESECVDVTAAGEVRQRVRWRHRAMEGTRP